MMFNAFNKAFLVDGSYYKQSLSDAKPINTWQSSLNILVAQDAYERTGREAHKALVNELCASWLRRTPPPWDGWNDDIGWFAMWRAAKPKAGQRPKYLGAGTNAKGAARCWLRPRS